MNQSEERSYGWKFVFHFQFFKAPCNMQRNSKILSKSGLIFHDKPTKWQCQWCVNRSARVQFCNKYWIFLKYFQIYQSIFSVFLGLSWFILVYLGLSCSISLSWSIAVYLGLSRSISGNLGLSSGYLGYLVLYLRLSAGSLSIIKY